MNKRQAKKKRKRQEELARIHELLQKVQEALLEIITNNETIKEALQRVKDNAGNAQGREEEHGTKENAVRMVRRDA